MGKYVLSDRYVVLICLGSTVVMLCCTMWQQQRILGKFPDVQNQRRRFHAGVLSFFFSPTAGHVWFSLVFPWPGLILVDYWFFCGQITAIKFESQLLWTIHAFFVLSLGLPLLCFQQLERELEHLQQSHRLEQDRQIIRRQIAAIRARQSQR